MGKYRYHELPLSEETAFGIWSQLRRQIENTASCGIGDDPLNKQERKLYEMLTLRFTYEALIIGFKSKDVNP